MSRFSPNFRWIQVLGLIGTAVIFPCLAGAFGQEISAPSAKEPSGREGAPNIILIVVDSLRADMVGTYGRTQGLTPVIDQIADEGIVFERCAAAAPWTLPSMASMFVSVYPDVHQMIGFTEGAGDGRISVRSALKTGFFTLAERLRENGYQTAGFSANPFVCAKFGFGQGFDHLDSRFASNSTGGKVVSGLALDWLRRHRDPARPLFLYVHYMDVHGPYDAETRFMTPLVDAVERTVGVLGFATDVVGGIPPYIDHPTPDDHDGSRHRRLKGFREYWVARYKAGVMQADANLRQLVAGLEAIGIWDQSLVILTADHGEALGEHGLWDHGFSLYETDLHVPLIVRWPHHVTAGRRYLERVSLVDVLPTILSAVGIDAGSGIDGAPMALIESEAEVVEGPRLASGVKSEPLTVALFEGNVKLVVSLSERPGEGGRPERGRTALFDLDEDPGETNNLANERPKAVLEMWSRVMSFTADRPDMLSRGPAQPAQVDEEAREGLESLGYLEPRGNRDSQ